MRDEIDGKVWRFFGWLDRWIRWWKYYSTFPLRWQHCLDLTIYQSFPWTFITHIDINHKVKWHPATKTSLSSIDELDETRWSFHIIVYNWSHLRLEYHYIWMKHSDLITLSTVSSVCVLKVEISLLFSQTIKTGKVEIWQYMRGMVYFSQ